MEEIEEVRPGFNYGHNVDVYITKCDYSIEDTLKQDLYLNRKGGRKQQINRTLT